MQAFGLSKRLFGPRNTDTPLGGKVGILMQLSTQKTSTRGFRAKPRQSKSATVAGPQPAVTAAVFATDLDWMALAHCDDVVQGLTFGHATPRQAVAALSRVLNTPEHAIVVDVLNDAANSSRAVDDIVDRLRRYASGERVDFSDVRIDDRHLASFGRRVAAACRRIPRGQTRSYGQLAAVCGSPTAARAVGQVMAKNRYPLVVPCHRVLAAGGALGGFSAPQGLAMKRRLLAMERAKLGAPQLS